MDRADWDSYPSRVERNTDVLLDLLARHGAHGTFFTLGWVARRFPSWCGGFPEPVTKSPRTASGTAGFRR